MNLQSVRVDKPFQKAPQIASPVLIDLDRMKSALAAERFTMPQGLSREEMRQHIIASARGK